MKPTRIVTLFLYDRGRILLLLRSQAVKTLRGHWAGLSGRIEHLETPRDAALREMEEEVGLSPGDVRLQIEGDPVRIPDPRSGVLWVVHPILATLGRSVPLTLDWEHAGYRWVFPEEMTALRIVPGLPEALGGLLGGLDLQRLAPWRDRIQDIVEDRSSRCSHLVVRTAGLLADMVRSGLDWQELDAMVHLLSWAGPGVQVGGWALGAARGPSRGEGGRSGPLVSARGSVHRTRRLPYGFGKPN